MLFKYNENKSIKNKLKHSISFEEAKALWENENALIVPANTINDEIRYAFISKLNDKCYVAIFRIISVRRCRKNEEVNYEKNIS